MSLSPEVWGGLSAVPPSRKAVAELLTALANTASISAEDNARLGFMTVKFCKDATKKEMDECERVGLVYAVMLILLGNTKPALANDEGVVCRVTQLLSSLCLSGLVLWSEAGWLSELVEGDPMRLAASNAKCHASLVEEIQRTRRRGARLGKLLGQKQSTVKAALRWRKKTGGQQGEEDEEQDGQNSLEGANSDGDETREHGDGSSVSSSSSSSGSSSSSSSASSSSSSTGDSATTSGTTTSGTTTTGADAALTIALDTYNLFSPASLRHSALATLAVVHTHCRSMRVVGLRNAFLSSGGLDAALLLGYVSFGETNTKLKEEKKAVTSGSVEYDYKTSLASACGGDYGGGDGGDGDGDAASVASSNSTATGNKSRASRSSSAASMRLEFQQKQAAALEATRLEIEQADKPVPSLVDQARSHLEAAALVSQAQERRQQEAAALVVGGVQGRGGGGGGIGGCSVSGGGSIGDGSSVGSGGGGGLAATGRGGGIGGRGGGGAERAFSSNVRSLTPSASDVALASVGSIREQETANTKLLGLGLSRRTAMLAEALLCQFDSGDLVQLRCLRANAVRKLEKATQAPTAKAAAAAAAAAGNRHVGSSSSSSVGKGGSIRGSVSVASVGRGINAHHEGENEDDDVYAREEEVFAFHHPLRSLDKCRALSLGVMQQHMVKHAAATATAAAKAGNNNGAGIGSGGGYSGGGTGGGSEAAYLRSLSVVAQLRHPSCAWFRFVSTPLDDCLKEKAAAELQSQQQEDGSGGGAVSSSSSGGNGSGGGGGVQDGVAKLLKSDAKQARRAAKDKGLGLRERLAAAVAGARIENVAQLRQSQVTQQRALGLYGRATASRALLELSTMTTTMTMTTTTSTANNKNGAGGGGADNNNNDVSQELATRLTSNLVSLVQARVEAEEKRAEPKAHARVEEEDDDDDDDGEDDDKEGGGEGGSGNASPLPGSTPGGSGGRRRRRSSRRNRSSSLSPSGKRGGKKKGSGGGGDSDNDNDDPRPVISVEELRAGKEGRVENEHERRVRRTKERKFEVANREHILEAREALELNRIRMVFEDKRSAKVAKQGKELAAKQLASVKQANKLHLERLATFACEQQRKGLTPEDRAVTAHYGALAQEQAQLEQALRLEAKKRGQAEVVHLADLRATRAIEDAEAAAAAQMLEAAEVYKKERKEAAVELVKSVKVWKKAVDLHERQGVVYRGKSDVVSRLHSGLGGFKLIDGELRWRDQDSSGGWFEPGDPRQHKDAHPLLKALLTPGTVKTWQWRKGERPEPPAGMPEEEEEGQEEVVVAGEEQGGGGSGGGGAAKRKGESGANEEAQATILGEATSELTRGGPGGNNAGSGEEEDGEEGIAPARPKKGWAQGQVYSSG